VAWRKALRRSGSLPGIRLHGDEDARAHPGRGDRPRVFRRMRNAAASHLGCAVTPSRVLLPGRFRTDLRACRWSCDRGGGGTRTRRDGRMDHPWTFVSDSGLPLRPDRPCRRSHSADRRDLGGRCRNRLRGDAPARRLADREGRRRSRPIPDRLPSAIGRLVPGGLRQARDYRPGILTTRTPPTCHRHLRATMRPATRPATSRTTVSPCQNGVALVGFS
jgi:hypothetical protein